MADVRVQVLLFLAMYVLLAVEYHRFVYPNYSYIMGFDLCWRPLAVVTGVVMVAAAVWALWSGALTTNGGASCAATLVGVLFFLPSVVMYQFGGTTAAIPLYSLLLVALLSFNFQLVRHAHHKSSAGHRPFFNFQFPRVPRRWVRWVLPLVTLAAMLPFPLTFGWHPDLSLFAMGEETYQVREACGAQGNVFTAYLMGPLRLVLLPMMVVMGLKDFRRDWWMAVAGGAGMMALYLMVPQKSIFFSLAVVVAFFLWEDYGTKRGFFLLMITLVCGLTVLLHAVGGMLMPESIAVRRLFFIPVIVGDNYFTFFDGHPMLLSHSFLSRWFEYPYTVEPSRLIGEMMYWRTNINCNTGVVADGFMNFGHAGALLFVAGAAVFIRLVSSQLRDPRCFGLVALLVLTMLNSALFTTLLTHGGLALLLAGCFLELGSSENRRSTTLWSQRR